MVPKKKNKKKKKNEKKNTPYEKDREKNFCKENKSFWTVSPAKFAFVLRS